MALVSTRRVDIVDVFLGILMKKGGINCELLMNQGSFVYFRYWYARDDVHDHYHEYLKRVSSAGKRDLMVPKSEIKL